MIVAGVLIKFNIDPYDKTYSTHTSMVISCFGPGSGITTQSLKSERSAYGWPLTLGHRDVSQPGTAEFEWLAGGMLIDALVAFLILASIAWTFEAFIRFRKSKKPGACIPR